MENITVKILGVRGAMPVSGKEYMKYGTATSCILVQIGKETILFDAGTGLLNIRNYLKDNEKSIHILLSHPHLDHIEGLTSCPMLFEKDAKVAVYTTPKGTLSAIEQVETLLSPPLWPVGVSVFGARVSFHDIVSSSFFIGNVGVQVMEGSHPGGCSVFRLSYGGKSIVYATDFEQDKGMDEQLYTFAKDCTLFLCDGEYTEKELLQKRSFGHSSWHFAAKIGAKCGGVQTKIIHHSLHRRDEELDSAEKALKTIYPNCSFAREGEVFIL